MNLFNVAASYLEVKKNVVLVVLCVTNLIDFVP